MNHEAISRSLMKMTYYSKNEERRCLSMYDALWRLFRLKVPFGEGGSVGSAVLPTAVTRLEVFR